MTELMAEYFPEDVRAGQKRVEILCLRELPARSTTGHDCVRFRWPVCQLMTAHGLHTTASADLSTFHTHRLRLLFSGNLMDLS